MNEWIYVPKEATQEMLKAGEAWSGLPSATWSDMVDASPLAEGGQTPTPEESYEQGYSHAKEDLERLKQALLPFRSGGDWGKVKAMMVIYAKEGEEHWAKRLTEWQVKVDEVLMSLDKRSAFEEERGDWMSF